MAKKYQVSDSLIENIPSKKGEDSDFKKYRGDSKSTTWVVLNPNTKTINYLTQINYKNKFYAGFVREPFELFLNSAKSLNIIVNKVEKEFKNKSLQDFPLSENFKLQILEQNIFDEYMINKINALVNLMMSVESFANNIIPSNFQIKRNGKLISKTEIEKHLSLKEKLKEVIPEFIELNMSSYNKLSSRIYQLNEIRNDLVHLKTTNANDKMDPFLKQYENLVSLKLNKEIELVDRWFKLVKES
ncbi:hypothetical protein BTO09_13860 [Gilvibacter sp. SZ-19]|uniref:hypothetical protein n=1 Tax=Gilvibacter sp. SZ-19 TaxID=754429 RepID=UPI000B3CF38E|nr:hypothetical protein [Gilvibacter sp. SZ-19]ARV13359.1 hypothetical protein BTO09_13860 [Gilvibacter sp. SZ-19]